MKKRWTYVYAIPLCCSALILAACLGTGTARLPGTDSGEPVAVSSTGPATGSGGTSASAQPASVSNDPRDWPVSSSAKPGSRAEDAVPVSPDTWYKGMFTDRKDEKWFRIRASDGVTYSLFIDDEFGSGAYSADSEIYIYDSASRNAVPKAVGLKNGYFREPFTVTSHADGDLFVKIRSDNPGTTTFLFGFGVSTTAGGDARPETGAAPIIAGTPEPAPVGRIELPIRRSFDARDLAVTKLSGERSGADILFTLEYESGKDRFVSLFNPPEGNVLRYMIEDGLRPEESSLTFRVPGKAVAAVIAFAREKLLTMKFTVPSSGDSDWNFLVIDVESAPFRSLLSGITADRTFVGTDRRTVKPEAKTVKPGMSPRPTWSKYDDVRGKDLSGEQALDGSWISTFWFNGTTDFGNLGGTAEAILESGKNPGLGVRELHRLGITGRGVRLAIIDQNLAGTAHPEYGGKVAEYRDFGCNHSENEGSMHGPAVLSLLAGETTGTAPGALVYYAAVPSWLTDAEYYADALDWITDKNRELTGNEKIRAVSVSAAPSGECSPFTKNNAAWDRAVERAEAEGILVLDCTSDHGFIGPAFFDPDDRESPGKLTGGFPGSPSPGNGDGAAVPCSPRTTAEEYAAGYPSYQYTGRGGLSWSIPYAAGVLAMGWQLRPELNAAEMKRILFETCAVGVNGARVIDPPAFINRLKAEAPHD